MPATGGEIKMPRILSAWRAINHYAEQDRFFFCFEVVATAIGQSKNNGAYASKVAIYNDNPRMKHPQIIRVLGKAIEGIPHATLHQGRCYVLL
jgi:hypothetical protein